jgi:hypothetical protein
LDAKLGGKIAFLRAAIAPISLRSDSKIFPLFSHKLPPESKTHYRSQTAPPQVIAFMAIGVAPEAIPGSRSTECSWRLLCAN